jgi:predicted aspartyl protease
MANGNVAEFPVSEAYLTVGDGATCLDAIADKPAPVLIGLTTLELLGLQVDPATGKLTSLEPMILWHSARNCFAVEFDGSDY